MVAKLTTKDFINKSIGELYKKTLRKEETYKKAGYNVVSIWESDYDG